ncbi:MAG: aspartate aminotransferase family protein [Alphaproteobacteria bacterium]
MPTYARAPLSFERGEGAYLFGNDGRRYLDFAAGIAVDSLGHAHPHLVAALTAQAQDLWHVSNLYEIPQQAKYAERLVAATFADAAFFCNSGAEAIECALKVARRYHAEQGAPERFRTVTVQGAFHGRTLATIAAGGNPKYTEGFGPPVDGFDQVAFGNLNELRTAIGSQTAAIMIEPVQGEGGIRAMDADYLRGLRQAADEFGILLIYDEIQTGFGRTGKLFAHEWSGVTPDIMAVAKGIAGGFPCGACLATARVSNAMSPGIHGTTFGGNPLAMAVANATLDVILADGFLANVVAMSARLKERFIDLAKTHGQIIDDVRGMGLMLGMRVAEGRTNADFNTRLRDQGLLCVPAGENVVRFVPPLIIGPTEVDLAVEMIDAACTAWLSESEHA